MSRNLASVPFWPIGQTRLGLDCLKVPNATYFQYNYGSHKNAEHRYHKVNDDTLLLSDLDESRLAGALEALFPQLAFLPVTVFCSAEIMQCLSANNNVYAHHSPVVEHSDLFNHMCAFTELTRGASEGTIKVASFFKRTARNTKERGGMFVEEMITALSPAPAFR